MILEGSGVEVELFDARDRVGGRLHTVDRDGLVYDAGGEWLDADHSRALSLARSLGLEPLPADPAPSRVHFKGEYSDETTLWSDVKNDLGRFERTAKAMLDEMDVKGATHTTLGRLDARTVKDLIRMSAVSERGAWWLEAYHRSDEGEDVDKIGMLGWLRTYQKYLARGGTGMSAFRIPGGMGALINKMAAGLKTQPKLNKPLRKVERCANEVKLYFDDGETVADQAVLAIPPTTLRQIEFSPAVSIQKQDALKFSAFSRTIKVVLEFTLPWWSDSGWNGKLFTDRPIQQVWDGTLGERPVLTAYVCGAAAEAIAKRPDAPKLLLEDLAVHFPQAKDHFVDGWLHDWISDPWSQGGFSYGPPGFTLKHFPHLGQLEGRVHFAGEHTAEYTGFIEGALESAERVATEVRLA